MSQEVGAPSPRTRVKRGANRASYDQDHVRDILADGFFCHLGVVHQGHPAIIPTAYAVMGDQIYLHGNRRNRIYQALLAGSEACVSVTLLDGLVLARSAFHHSVNYRAVVIYGSAREVEDEAEKRAAFSALIDHVAPGRSTEARSVNQAEFDRTLVLALPLAEASVKVRTGPPVDEEEDYDLDIWAGEIPLRLVASAPVADPRNKSDLSASVEDRARQLGGMQPPHR